MITQLNFRLNNHQSEYSSDFLEEAAYLGAKASLELCHQGVGWIWDGFKLETKAAPMIEDDEDGTCHFTLFGNKAYSCSIRGWFISSLNVCTLMQVDRKERFHSPDMMPERLWRALVGKFGKKVKFKIV